MVRTDWKTVVPVAASGTTTPNSFSIATTNWRASMESSPRPAPNRGASLSISACVIPSMRRLSIIICFTLPIISSVIAIFLLLLSLRPVIEKIVPLVGISPDIGFKDAQQPLGTLPNHCSMAGMPATQINRLFHDGGVASSLEHHKGGDYRRTSGQGQIGGADRDGGGPAEKIECEGMGRTISLAEESQHLVAAQCVDRLDDRQRRAIVPVHIDVIDPPPVPRLRTRRI